MVELTWYLFGGLFVGVCAGLIVYGLLSLWEKKSGRKIGEKKK